MPALQPPARILVTGATGYIAIWIVRSLLDTGFSVVGTARSSSKAEYLHQTFAEESRQGRFTTVIVDDMERPGAFDGAVKGVDGIAHTASPVHTSAEDPNELIQPAVKGTMGVLESTLKHNSQCKRIIILSSCSAVVKPGIGRPLVDEDWNEHSVGEVERLGKDATPIDKYRASKTLAEKGAWDFHARHQEEVGWDIVTIQPPFVYGPILHQAASPEALNTSMKLFFDVVCRPKAGGKSDGELVAPDSWRTDVREVAQAHTRAFLTEQAGGNRFIISAAPYTWQEFLDVARSVFPQASAIYQGRSGAGSNVTHHVAFDSTKSKRVLGIEYRSLEETVKDAIIEFEKRGWFKIL